MHRFHPQDIFDLAVFLTDITPTSQIQVDGVLEETFGVNFAGFCHLANAVPFSCLPSSHLNEDQELTHVSPYRQFEDGIEWLERTGGLTTAPDVQPEDQIVPLPDSPGAES